MGRLITTGQIIFRSEGDADDGRKLWSVFGILATPPETQIQGEHQYVVTGGVLGGIISELAGTLNGLGEATGRHKLMLTVHLDDGAIDRTEEGKANTPNGLLQDPIWKV